MQNEKIAVIDLGTNTFHLLITEHSAEGLKTLYKEKVAVKIGQNGISKGFIAADAYERAIRTLEGFKRQIDHFNVKKTFATGTSAIRNSRNGYQLIKDIKQNTGIEVTIISGEREAELIYYGVKAALDLGKCTSMVMDIGGGSVEFIICNAEQIFWKESFEIGAQRLLDLFHKTDPISPAELQSLVDYLEQKLTSLIKAVEIYKPVALVGSSGTFDTLCEIDVQKKGINFSLETEKEYTLMLDAFESIYFEIITKDRNERMEIPGMVEMRVDMIVVASSLIYYVLHAFRINKIRVSAYALKEGVLATILKGEPIN
ncbi:MAG TPA: phosphatase [Cytophagaceae bacterium]